jgi:hypothetical protein
LRAKG